MKGAYHLRHNMPEELNAMRYDAALGHIFILPN
jgi:hypothetical protein